MFLKELRKAEKLTADQLGMIVGVTGRAIRGYESGEKHPSAKVADRLKRHFKLSPEEAWEVFYASRTRDTASPRLGCAAAERSALSSPARAASERGKTDAEEPHS